MKKEETPQDKSSLENVSQELCYVKNSDGKYETSLSSGWDVKKDALDDAWNEIHEKTENARAEVENGSKSPLYFHKEKNLMTISLLASYVKLSKIRVWWHMRPSAYKKLKPTTLQKYAKVFNVTPEELSTLK